MWLSCDTSPHTYRSPMRNRTNPRHPAFDSRTFATYFVTICALSEARKCSEGRTHDRRCLFGVIRDGRMILNGRGKIAASEWERSEAMRDEVLLDAFVVMPNHLHGIVCLVPPAMNDVSPRGYELDVGTDTTRGENVSNGDVGPHRASPCGPTRPFGSSSVGGRMSPTARQVPGVNDCRMQRGGNNADQ